MRKDHSGHIGHSVSGDWVLRVAVGGKGTKPECVDDSLGYHSDLMRMVGELCG